MGKGRVMDDVKTLPVDRGTRVIVVLKGCELALGHDGFLSSVPVTQLVLGLVLRVHRLLLTEPVCINDVISPAQGIFLLVFSVWPAMEEQDGNV